MTKNMYESQITNDYECKEYQWQRILMKTNSDKDS